MNLLKLVAAIVVSAIVLLALTVAYVIAMMRGAKAIGLDALRSLTLYYPLYWLGVIAVIFVLWLFFRRVLFAS